MYTLIPQGAQIKLLFALRQAVFEIEPIYACACAHAHAYDKNKNLPNIHSMVATLPQGAQIKLLFALRQAVFEIEPTYACACAHARAYDKNKNVAICVHLYPRGPKLGFFSLYGKRFST